MFSLQTLDQLRQYLLVRRMQIVIQRQWCVQCLQVTRTESFILHWLLLALLGVEMENHGQCLFQGVSTVVEIHVAV